MPSMGWYTPVWQTLYEIMKVGWIWDCDQERFKCMTIKLLIFCMCHIVCESKKSRET